MEHIIGKFYVIYFDDDRCLYAASREFSTIESAREYKDTIHASRSPVIVTPVE